MFFECNESSQDLGHEIEEKQMSHIMSFFHGWWQLFAGKHMLTESYCIALLQSLYLELVMGQKGLKDKANVIVEGVIENVDQNVLVRKYL